MCLQDGSLLRLRILAETDPSVLARVLERFENLNVIPRRVVAEADTTGTIAIEVDVSGLPVATVSRIVAKLGQNPCILAAS